MHFIFNSCTQRSTSQGTHEADYRTVHARPRLLWQEAASPIQPITHYYQVPAPGCH